MPGRTAAAGDVAIDTLGAVVGQVAIAARAPLPLVVVVAALATALTRLVS